MSAVKTSLPTVEGWIKLSQDTREGIHGDEARESIDRKSKSGEFYFSLSQAYMEEISGRVVEYCYTGPCRKSRAEKGGDTM
jgi:hypothetical protein